MLATAELDEWTALARSRAPANAPYAGELTPREAWQLLETHPEALLVDVRTPREWQEVGVPSLPGGRSVLRLPWLLADGMANPEFSRKLGEAAWFRVPVLFICRVGGRSFDAANTAARNGYTHAFNVTCGFEGVADATGVRGTVNGWMADGLPTESASGRAA